MSSRYSVPFNANDSNTIHLKTVEDRPCKILSISENAKQRNSKIAFSDFFVAKHKDSLCFSSLDLTKSDKEKNFLLQYDKITSKSSSLSSTSSLKALKTIEKGFSYHWRSAFPVNFSNQITKTHITALNNSTKATPCVYGSKKKRDHLDSQKVLLDLQSKSSQRLVYKPSLKGDSYRPSSSRVNSVTSPRALKSLPHSNFLKNLSPTLCKKTLECNVSFAADSKFKLSEGDGYDHAPSTKSEMSSMPTIFEALRDSYRYGDLIGSLLPSLPPPSPLPSLLSQGSSVPSYVATPFQSAKHSTSFLPTPEDRILIRTGSSLHQDFLIPSSFIYQSKTLLHFLTCSFAFAEYQEKCIRLPSIEPIVFQSILEYLSFSTSRSLKHPWDPPDELVLEIAEVAFYLNLPTIVDACAKKVVQLLPHIESLDFTPPPLLHIYLKQFSIDQLLYTELNLLPKDFPLDMKPYWLSLLHKYSSPLLAAKECSSFTTNSIRTHLSPSIALPLPSTPLSEISPFFHINPSKSKYRLPSQVITDVGIRFYCDFFQHNQWDLHLILQKNSNLVFNASFFDSNSLAMKKTSKKSCRISPRELPISLEQLSVTQEVLPDASPSVPSNPVSDSLPMVSNSGNRVLIQVSLDPSTFSQRNQLSIFASWPITHLTLEECPILEAQFSFFCSWLQSTPRLTYLSVQRCFGSSSIGKFFQALSFHSSLTVLKVSILMEDQEQLQTKLLLKNFTSITTLPQLHQLSLTHFQFMPSLLLSTLDLLLTCHAWLVHLDLSYTRLGSHFTKLLQVRWSHLTHLILTHTHLPTSSLHFALQQWIPAFPKLTHLDFSFNPFTMSLLEQCTLTLPLTCLTHFTFNLTSTFILPNVSLYSTFFQQGLPSTLTFLSFQHHVIPLPFVLDLISRRSIFLVCELDSPVRKELKRQLKTSPFPSVLWCNDGIFTNLPCSCS